MFILSEKSMLKNKSENDMKHVEILPFFYNSSRPLVYILKSLLIFHLMKCKRR